LAKNIVTGELVALKTPSVNFEDDTQYLQYFMYEQWVGQRIQSPNVVKIIPFSKSGGTGFWII
jgi:protein phosphatase